VKDINLYDDTNILSEEQISKTFGIKYLFMVAHEGYLTHPASESIVIAINEPFYHCFVTLYQSNCRPVLSRSIKPNPINWIFQHFKREHRSSAWLLTEK
jgi:hypothetical protein